MRREITNTRKRQNGKDKNPAQVFNDTGEPLKQLWNCQLLSFVLRRLIKCLYCSSKKKEEEEEVEHLKTDKANSILCAFINISSCLDHLLNSN